MVDIDLNNVESKEVYNFLKPVKIKYRLEAEIKASMNGKQFRWQDICFNLTRNHNHEELISIAKLLGIQRENYTKRELCVLISKQM
jgi:hypothetical protein